MLRGDFGIAVLDYDYGPTDPATVTRDVNGPVMVIHIYAHELAKPARPAQPSEIGDKPGRIARQSKDGSVHIHNKGMWAVYLRTSSHADILKRSVDGGFPRDANNVPSTPSMNAKRTIGSSSTSVVI